MYHFEAECILVLFAFPYSLSVLFFSTKTLPLCCVNFDCENWVFPTNIDACLFLFLGRESLQRT